MAKTRRQRLVAVAVLLAAAGAAAQTPAPAPTLTAQELFRQVAPSIFVVHTFDAQGEPLALGSGVALTPSAIITNQHVTEGAVSFRLEQKGKAWPAELGRCDTAHDVCLLEAPGLEALPAKLREATPAQAGERVYAVGAPLGLDLTISDGIVSGMRQIKGGAVIQISAPISHGSSGGGLFDANAQLLGITEAYLDGGQNLSFAVPVDGFMALAGPRAAGGADRIARPPLPLRAVHLVCVESLGDSVGAKTAQDLIMSGLVQAGSLAVTEACGQADAALKGFVQISQSAEAQSQSERDLALWSVGAVRSSQRQVVNQTVALELRLVDAAGHVIWADAEQSNGGLSSDAVHDAVNRAVSRLTAALARQR